MHGALSAVKGRRAVCYLAIRAFLLIGVIYGQYSDKIFARFLTNQRVPKKVPVSKRMQFHPAENPLLDLSLRVPSCPRAPSTTCVPAELRLNWVNVARVAVGDGGQSYWLLEQVTPDRGLRRVTPRFPVTSATS